MSRYCNYSREYREDYRREGYPREGHRREESANNDYEERGRQRIERPNVQHTHEYLDSVKIAEQGEDAHNHRFAGITGKAILSQNNHYHLLESNTDIYEDHIHRINDRTGLGIMVGDGRHVHFVSGHSSVEDGHRHAYEFATLIDDPIGR